MCEARLEWMNRCLTLKLNQAVQSSLWVNLNLRRVPSWKGTAISNCELRIQDINSARIFLFLEMFTSMFETSINSVNK